MNTTTYDITIRVTVDNEKFETKKNEFVTALRNNAAFAATCAREGRTVEEALANHNEDAVNGMLSSLLELIHTASGIGEFPTKYGTVNIPRLGHGAEFSLTNLGEIREVVGKVQKMEGE